MYVPDAVSIKSQRIRSHIWVKLGEFSTLGQLAKQVELLPRSTDTFQKGRNLFWENVYGLTVSHGRPPYV